MAFPTLQAENSSFEQTATTSASVDLPASISADDLLVLIFACRPTVISTPDGWTVAGSSSAVNTDLVVFYKIAAGDEGSSVTVTTQDPMRSVHRTCRFTGHATGTSLEVEFDFLDSDSFAPNSPLLTPSGGTADYYWITMYGQRTIAISEPSYPASYGNTGYETTNDTGSGTFNGAWADRELNASSEDPGAFTTPDSDDWSAATIAIFPAGSSPTVTFSDANGNSDFINLSDLAVDDTVNWEVYSGIDVETFGSAEATGQDPVNSGTLELTLTGSSLVKDDPVTVIIQSTTNNAIGAYFTTVD